MHGLKNRGRAQGLLKVGCLSVCKSAVQFMKKRLHLGNQFIGSMGPIVCERVPFGPKTKIRNKIIVRFRTTEARDVVRSAATNLAGADKEVGIRLEVPNHLKSDMKSLQAEAP